jgi:NhaA family Na+:H+ antiporter
MQDSTPSPVQRRRETVDRLTGPVQRFIATEISGGILLIVGLAVALAWANSPWADGYSRLLHHHLAIDLGFWSIDEPLEFWVNDLLMTVFFFVVGLEIKRELVAGELARFRQAIIPVSGAIGGMALPILIYVVVLRGQPGSHGWGVPVATDIAFALGVLMLAGSRVPFTLKVILLALAIVDDIGGILIIAIFYSDGIAIGPLALAGGTVLLCLALRQAGIWYLPLYWAIGAVGWAATFESGIHPTIFGVAMGLLAPWQAWRPAAGFVPRMRALVARVQEIYDPETQQATHSDQVALGLEIASEAHDHVSPLDRLEHALSPFSAYVIAPLFAFANAGVAVDTGTLRDAFGSPVAQGVVLGLVIGKPLGILLAIRIAVAFGARLPEGVTWGSILGLGIVAGIGFTVALFIAGLSFEEAGLLAEAKLGILAASLVAGVLGWTVLRLVHAPRSTA